MAMFVEQILTPNPNYNRISNLTRKMGIAKTLKPIIVLMFCDQFKYLLLLSSITTGDICLVDVYLGH